MNMFYFMVEHVYFCCNNTLYKFDKHNGNFNLFVENSPYSESSFNEWENRWQLKKFRYVVKLKELKRGLIMFPNGTLR